MKHNFKKILPFLILNTAAICAIIILVYFRSPESRLSRIERDSQGEFLYTSPILDCEPLEGIGTAAISGREVREESERLADTYGVSDFSVYYRDLNNGPWIGINEKEFFSPASLMKTPMLIAFLKNVQRNPDLLKKEVVAKEEYFAEAYDQSFNVENRILKGEKYSLEEIARQMIVESDNVAMLMLTDYVELEDLIDLLKAIGATYEEPHKDSDIRVKDFAGFFRVLYNASYLNREMSEFALSMLSSSSFKDGIVAGVPENVVVAHKYGERSLEGSSLGVQMKQLHDCGIVYSKKNPYILCIMTKGKDFVKQERFISDVSKFIYTQINEI